MPPAALFFRATAPAPASRSPQASESRVTPSSRWLLVSPLLVIAATAAVFQITRSQTANPRAQLAGFVFYWAIIGVVLPLLFLGRRGYVELFAARPMEWNTTLRAVLVVLFLPAAYGFLFAFPMLFPAESSWLLPSLALYALVNGTTEEVYWRGLFMSRFPTTFASGVLYPATCFAAWQLVPWSLFHSWLRPAPVLVFLVALCAGLFYNWFAWRTRSIKWTIMAHVLTNLSGIGALLLFAPPG